MASCTLALLTWMTDAAHSDYVALLPGHRGVIHASNALGFAGNLSCTRNALRLYNYILFHLRIGSNKGAVLTTIMYGAPLSVMWEVVRTKSVEFMPLPLSAMSFLNSAVWSLYGFYSCADALETQQKSNVFQTSTRIYGVVLCVAILICSDLT